MVEKVGVESFGSFCRACILSFFLCRSEYVYLRGVILAVVDELQRRKLHVATVNL